MYSYLIQYVDKNMEEIVMNKVLLPDSERAIAPPEIHIKLTVEDGCNAVLKKGKTKEVYILLYFKFTAHYICYVLGKH